jgi:hypothetical protein
LTAPSYRAYAPGDEAQILALYDVAFGLSLSLDEWRWHYGHGAIIEVAVADGRIVGHYAVQPRPFCVGARGCTAGLVLGSMVAPEFRNITTFLDLANRAYARCRELAIPFVYAFPNDNVWLVRRRMLSWNALPSITALGMSPSSASRDRDASGVERLGFGEALPAAPWLGCATTDRIRSADPATFLRWRLRDRPDVDYPMYIHREAGELSGYIALKRYATANQIVGHVVAFRVAPGAESSSGPRLLARAIDHFAMDGVDRITTWVLPASPLHDVVIGAGFTPELGSKKNFGYLAFDEEIGAMLADGARWDIAMADSDVY